MVLDIADGQIQAVNSIVNPTSSGASDPWPSYARRCAGGSDSSAHGLELDRDH
jgi:hypothetical protein